MPKGERIGKDVLGKKGKMTAKESKKFEEFKAKREAEKRKKPEEEAEELEGKELKTKIPEEGQPTDEQLAKERAKDIAELAKWKEEGKTEKTEEDEEAEEKDVFVNEHLRSRPKRK